MAHRFKGTVTQLYVDDGQCYISIQGMVHPTPKDGIFALRLGHPNYNALYSLTLAAAVNGYPLTIRIKGEIENVDPEQYPTVAYLVVGW